MGLFAAWRAGVPRRIGFEQGDIYLRSWKFRAANFIGQYLAHHIIVCSQALADWNHRVHRIDYGRMSILHNCVDLDRFSPPQSRGDATVFGLPPESMTFCAVGTLGNGVNKRVDILIRAIAEARTRGAGVGLLICGDGDQRADLESVTSSLGVERYVKFLGMRGDVARILGACDAFCHAAPFEPFGIVCVEAMAMRLPVLVPDSGGICEAVDDGVTGVIYPALDHEALAAAMFQLWQNADLREAMGQGARAAAERRFSVRDMWTGCSGYTVSGIRQRRATV